MAALTQADLAAQMVAQLRVLDPSISAEIGTPERKILDTVAQALADGQIDLSVLSGSLSIDSKFGASLDRFLALFGFARQQPTRATGFVTFSRLSSSDNDIPIPAGTQVQTATPAIIFTTQFDVTLAAGSTSIVAPVSALNAGAAANVGINTITAFTGSPVFGITGVINENPTTGGLDAETDDALKVRFRNTIFRNLAGTQDQYLALAAALPFTTKANVIGPVSSYLEYLQIPPVDDATAYANYPGGNGNGGEYTTALSSIPLSKHIYDTLPIIVATDLGSGGTFYRLGVDFRFNTLPATKNFGDAYRFGQDGEDVNPLTNVLKLNAAFPQAFVDSTFRPNITFMNVYTGDDPTVTAPRALDAVVTQHYYLSDASRNDVSRNVTNAVDVFIDGDNETSASAVIPMVTSTATFVNNNVTSLYYTENFRRTGEPEHRPLPGNLLTPLFNQPVTDLPDQLQIDIATYFKGIHYWPVEEIGGLAGTVRARNGVEWSIDVNGMAPSDQGGPFTGPTIVANVATSIEIDSYSYDQNVVGLQAALEGSKQVTTDVLGHRAKKRYFKLNIVVIYSPGFHADTVNQAISDAVKAFYANQYFGAIIQLSDLLQHIHEVPGVDSVRWTRDDIRGTSTTNRVVETDINGQPLTDVVVDRWVSGISSVTSEIQLVYFTRGWINALDGGSFTLTYGLNGTTTPISYLAAAGFVQAALLALGVPLVSVTGSGTPTDPYAVTFTASSGPQDLLISDPSGLLNGTATFNSDFFLKDNELPDLPTDTVAGDSLPGLIINTRAQNTFNRT